MIVTRYYTSNEDLNKSEEPYRSVVGLLDQLYTDVPEGCAVLNLSSFSLYHAVSAVRTIYENLKKNILTFNNTLLSTYKATKASYSIMRFDNFCLTSSRQVVLFGAVYYVAAQDLNFSNKHLKQIENISCSDKPSTAMFQYFKEPADKLREELLSHTPSGQVEGNVLPVVEDDPSKRIVLTKQIEDLERQLAEQKADNQKKQNEIATLTAQHPKNDTEAVKDTRDHEDAYYNKVCFEFFIRLMERSGLDLNNTGNKSRIGTLWHKITGKSAEELRRYCSMRNYQNNHTQVDIKALNELLSEMKFEEQL